MYKIFDFILDIIFPKFCLGCLREGTWLCKKCYQNIEISIHQHCPICRMVNNGTVCQKCKNKTPLNGLLICTNYEKKLIKKIIHYYKYRYIKTLYKPLGGLLVKNFYLNHAIFKPLLFEPQNTILISIALHKKRLLERGYNQSELLAKYLAKKTNLTYYDQLVSRKKHTNIQAKLNKEERFINLKSAFILNKEFDFHGKNVIIIDDVATTLATLDSCAKLLKRAGVNKIWGMVIARGEYK